MIDSKLLSELNIILQTQCIESIERYKSSVASEWKSTAYVECVRATHLYVPLLINTCSRFRNVYMHYGPVVVLMNDMRRWLQLLSVDHSRNANCRKIDVCTPYVHTGAQCDA